MGNSTEYIASINTGGYIIAQSSAKVMASIPTSK
jgi:hypothetical protein